MKLTEKVLFFDMKHRYVRSVTIHDTVDEQKRKINFYTTNITEEQHAKNKKRDQLQQLFNEILSQGDKLYITDLCILADSSKHLVELFDKAQELDVSIYIINLHMLIHADYTYAINDALHAISDIQSDVVKFKTQVGMEQSSKKGPKLGRPIRSDENLKNAIDMYMSKQLTLDDIK